MSTTFTLIGQTCRQLGVPLPKGLAQAAADAAAFIESVPKRDPSPPLAAALDAVQAGRDPYTDPAVVAWVVAHVLHDAGLGRAAGVRAERMVEDALAASADALLSSWSKVLTPRAAALADAVTAGVVDLRDPSVLRGERPREAWAKAAAAVDAYAVAENGLSTLIRELHRVKPDPLAVLTDAPPAQLTAVRADMSQGIAPVWAVAMHALPVRFVSSLAELERREHVVDGLVSTPAKTAPEKTASVV